MKRILVTAGGTATAWHICQVCNEFFCDKIEVYVCDINEPYLVPSSILAKKIFKVPYADSPEYLNVLNEIVSFNRIDCIIPLIPNEILALSSDSRIINDLGIISSAPIREASIALSDKELMYHKLISKGIETPRVFGNDEIDVKTQYFVKPKLGFGSLGTGIFSGEYILRNKLYNDTNVVIQELCDNREEITVEIFNGKNLLKVFARKRVATKSGVCVKMIPYNTDVFYPIVERLVLSMDMPIAFNLQFFKTDNVWKLFDCNLRLGAGTALSTAAGFQLTRAFIAELIGEKVLEEWFEVDSKVKSVLRVYEEVVIK